MESLESLLGDVQAEADAHDHLDLHWFPHTDRVMVKRNDRVAAGEGPASLPSWRRWLDDELMANRVYEVVNRAAARRPGLVRHLNRASAAAWSSREYADDSWRVFCATRDVRFVESEYAVPREAVADVLRELRGWIDRSDEALPFPVEVRFVGADDIWLSTAFERDNAYVAVHQYHRMEHRAYFAAFEAIVAEHAGRPHWGKMHSLGADRLRTLYPRFEDVLAVRDRLDPGRRFANDHLRHLLGD